MTNIYHAHFTAGALLYEETVSMMQKLEGVGTEERGWNVDRAWLNTNSEKTRENTAREINRRLNAVAEKTMWEAFLSSPETDQKVMLYYACCKAYSLLLDFHLEVVIDKWRSFNLELESSDFLNFLYRKRISHPEIEAWSETTQEKLAQVALKIMKQAGLVRQGKICKIPASDELWQRFVEMGEGWFLELMLLNAEERELYN